MKQKEIFYLHQPEQDKFLLQHQDNISAESSLILWHVRLYNHILYMPELYQLIEQYYFSN